VASIAGTLQVGEARATAKALLTRQRGSNASYNAIFLALVVFGIGVGVLSSVAATGGDQRHNIIGGALGAVAGSLSYRYIARRLMMSRFKREFKARQQTLVLPLRMVISPDNLTYELGGLTHIAQWSVVDELFRDHDYWIFSAQTNSMFAPRRLFANEEDEKAFVKEALVYMSREARSRSAGAARFANASLKAS
jgi:hypothetical protein